MSITVKAHTEPRPLLDTMSRSEDGEKITYQFGKTTFIVTPVYQTTRGESIAAIMLRLMKADVERV